MSKSNAFESAFLRLFFHGTSIPGIADNAADPLTSFYLSLHKLDPGEAGTQSTNEATYDGYARVAVARSTLWWSEASGVVTLLQDVDFPVADSDETLLFLGIGTAELGAGMLCYSGPLTPSITVSAGITPTVKTGTTIRED